VAAPGYGGYHEDITTEARRDDDGVNYYYRATSRLTVVVGTPTALFTDTFLCPAFSQPYERLYVPFTDMTGQFMSNNLSHVLFLFLFS